MNGGLKLFGEVVGIGHEGDVILAVELLEGLGDAAVVLRLGDETSNFIFRSTEVFVRLWSVWQGRNIWKQEEGSP